MKCLQLEPSDEHIALLLYKVAMAFSHTFVAALCIFQQMENKIKGQRTNVKNTTREDRQEKNAGK